jgi:3',5'-cyclic-AMP phosphodiesterase
MQSHDAPVTFVVPGDLHLTEPDRENHRVAQWTVEEINTLIRPDFVQFIGDNVQDATESQFLRFNELRARLKMPHHVLVGDHDVDKTTGTERFREFVGETYGLSAIRGFRFLRLNTQEVRPLGMSTEQVAWFRDCVEQALAIGERIVVFQHNYPYQIWENFNGPGIDGWREIVQTRRVEAIICGHTHYFQKANDGRNVTVATRSIGDPEGGPPGYLVGFVWGDDLALTYRSVEDRGPLVLVTHPRETRLATSPRHVVSGPNRFEVKVWSSQGLSSVRGRIDEGAWTDLVPTDHGLWSCPLSGDRLSKGEHHFEARASSEGGEEGSHRIRFMVDHTGRYTAVPGVDPLVSRTAFC